MVEYISGITGLKFIATQWKNTPSFIINPRISREEKFINIYVFKTPLWKRGELWREHAYSISGNVKVKILNMREKKRGYIAFQSKH